ncbi:MAG: DUF711 family protein [Bryobacteraceae bacterium]|jgi:uncharacterized protein (UPF0210 family)
MNRRQFIGSALLSGAGAALAKPAEPPAKPKVRAITAFLKLDRARYREQIQDTLQMLRRAKRVVEAGGYQVEGVRITTQPFPDYTRGLSQSEVLKFFREYDALAAQESFDPNIGPAMLHDAGDPAQAQLLGEILSATKGLEASLIIAGEEGIQWKCVQAAARMVKFVEEHSPGSAANFNFAATAMLAPYGPFYPGSYHLGEGRCFSVATEGANVVDRVFAATAGNAPLAAERLTRELSAHAVALEKLAQQIEKETGWTYMGIDATPAPLREVSIGAAIEKFTGAPFGSSGTMTAAAVITKAVQSVPVKRIGYSGLMLPVMEESLLAQRWSEGTYDMDALLAYSAVCGTGLDTIPMAGDVPQPQIERILGDVASLAVKWKKPLTARLLPVKGKKVGDRTEFDDPFLVNTLIRAVR